MRSLKTKLTMVFVYSLLNYIITFVESVFLSITATVYADFLSATFVFPKCVGESGWVSFHSSLSLVLS